MLEVRVIERRQEADGVISLSLAPHAGQTLPPFEAGSHIDLNLADGLRRQYSLCGDPAEASLYRIGVLLPSRSRGGSAWVHRHLVEGARISISAPRNLFALDESLDEYVLLAGGIGITPILAMARRLHTLGKAFSLHYCARSRSQAAFTQELADAPFGKHVRFHFDDEEEASFDVGAALIAARPARGLYVCGPGGFMDYVFEAALQRGWSESQLHREDFANAIDTTEDKAFSIIVRTTGAKIQVPIGVSAAKALEDAGYFVSTSCEQGICGSCLTPVLEGLPDHRDTFQTMEERSRNDQFTPCCSRALTESLVVEI